MSTTMAERRSLDELATEINRAHAACESCYSGALEHAFRCGVLLTEAKAQVAHGEWAPWLEENFAGADRTARAYMQLASAPNRQELADLGVEQALRTIAQPRPEPKPKAEESLAGLGSTDGAMAELGEPERAPMFPRAGMEQRTWREIRAELSKVERKMESARAQDLSDWSRAEYLEQAARSANEASQLLTELARALR